MKCGRAQQKSGIGADASLSLSARFLGFLLGNILSEHLTNLFFKEGRKCLSRSRWLSARLAFMQMRRPPRVGHEAARGGHIQRNRLNPADKISVDIYAPYI